MIFLFFSLTYDHFWRKVENDAPINRFQIISTLKGQREGHEDLESLLLELI